MEVSGFEPMTYQSGSHDTYQLFHGLPEDLDSVVNALSIFLKGVYKYLIFLYSCLQTFKKSLGTNKF